MLLGSGKSSTQSRLSTDYKEQSPEQEKDAYRIQEYAADGKYCCCQRHEYHAKDSVAEKNEKLDAHLNSVEEHQGQNAVEKTHEKRRRN